LEKNLAWEKCGFFQHWLTSNLLLSPQGLIYFIPSRINMIARSIGARKPQIMSRAGPLLPMSANYPLLPTLGQMDGSNSRDRLIAHFPRMGP